MARLQTILRAATAGSLLAGLVHLLVPDRLLAIAAWGYDRVLAVEFEPRTNATTRVRLVGVLFLVGATVLARLARAR
ncbi:hypothetical protein ACFQH2_15175 [Natronoarchaeum sp. GCM10025703]|uniref:hypothetical protein n=1 Tax=unclassified Natronoarchaeum TaxID=2620183 RepID=UPI00361A8CD0